MRTLATLTAAIAASLLWLAAPGAGSASYPNVTVTMKKLSPTTREVDVANKDARAFAGITIRAVNFRITGVKSLAVRSVASARDEFEPFPCGKAVVNLGEELLCEQYTYTVNGKKTTQWQVVYKRKLLGGKVLKLVLFTSGDGVQALGLIPNGGVTASVPVTIEK